MTLEVFYVDSCPNLQPTLNRVKEVLDETGLTANVVEQRVLDVSSAIAMRFLGSPTVQVNGVDVEPSARTSDEFGLTCRMYLSGERQEGVPPVQLLREAILAARDQYSANRVEE